MLTATRASYLCSAIAAAPPALRPHVFYRTGAFESLAATLGPRLSLPDSRFFRPAIANALGSKLFELIVERRCYIRFVELCFLESLQPTYEEMQLVFATQLFVEYNLLSLPFEKAGEPLTPLQDCVRLSLYIAAQQMILGAPATAVFIRIIAAQLKASLEKVDVKSLCVSNRELLLWVSFIMAHISGGEQDSAWCITQISALEDSLGLTTTRQVEEVLRGFHHFGETFSETISTVQATIWSDLNHLVEDAL